MTGLVFAGGKSSRMGRDKALLPYRGGTLLSHAVGLVKPLVDEVFVVTNNPNGHRQTGAGMILDASFYEGPMAALENALAEIAEGPVLVLGCDMPAIPSEFLSALVKASRDHPGVAVVARDSKGWQPLCAVYPVWVRLEIQRLMNAERSAMQDLMEAVRPLGFPGPDEVFDNVNTPEEYARQSSRV